MSNPYIHFMKSESWAGVTGVFVFSLLRIGAFIIEQINDKLPLRYEKPIHFAEMVFGWGAALASTLTFIMITAYQIVVLIKRLREE